MTLPSSRYADPSPRYADGQTLDIGGLTVRLRVSARARRISLRVDRLRREAVAVAPSVGHLPAAADFARSRRIWLLNHLAEAPAAPGDLAAGDQLVVCGLPWRLRPDGRRPRLLEEPGEATAWLAGCGAGVVDAGLVVRAVRGEAARIFGARAAVHCMALGVTAPPVSMMDARTRWGSCTPARPGCGASIRLSWRLALAPFAVADYVVAHECAHLREANHGPRFWNHVKALVGDPNPYRHWLRTKGASLYAILLREGA